MAVQTPKKSAAALPWPALVPLGHHAGKPPISLQKTVMLVGSRHNAHLHLMSRHVSKAHALILSHGGSVYIRDLASREKVYVNGAAVREAWLRNGDLIKIGSFTFKYKAGPTLAPGRDAPSEDADLEIEGAGAPLAVAEKVMLIGRRSTCDVSLVEASVSTAHAVIFHTAGRRYVRDLGSRTGTFVNGKKVHQQELNPGDSLRIGETDMRYALASAHDHHIEPVVADAGGDDEVDELEHLVGTARLDMAAELTGTAGQGAAADELHAVVGGDVEPLPVDEDDLVEFDVAPAERPTDLIPPGDEAASERPAFDPITDAPAAPPMPMVLHPLSLDSGRGSARDAHAEQEIIEIDLSSDPDVSDIPSAADTRAIGMEVEPEPAKPKLSDRVVDEPPAREPDAMVDWAGAENSPLVSWAPADDAAVTGGEGTTATEAATPVGGGESLDATWGDDLALMGDEELSARGGWQGMSRVEAPPIVEESETPLPMPEVPADESLVVEEHEELLPIPAADEPTADEAPVVEEMPVVEEVGAEGDAPVLSVEAIVPALPDEPAPLPLEIEDLEVAPDEPAGALASEASSYDSAPFLIQDISVAADEDVVADPADAPEDEAVADAVDDVVLEPQVPVSPTGDVSVVTTDASVVAAPDETAVADAPAVGQVESINPGDEIGVSGAEAQQGLADESAVSGTAAAEAEAAETETKTEAVDAEVAEAPAPVEPVRVAPPTVEATGKDRVSEMLAMDALAAAEVVGHFAKKGRARKGKAAKAEKKAAVVAKKQPTPPAPKGKGGRKGKKGYAQQVSIPAVAAKVVTPAAAAAAVDPGAGAVVAAAGIAGAAAVAGAVVGEETNVVAAEQGRAADVAGVVEESAAEVRPVPPAPVVDLAQFAETPSGAGEAAAGMESPDGDDFALPELELAGTDVVAEPADDLGMGAFEIERVDEVDALAEAMIEAPHEAPAEAEATAEAVEAPPIVRPAEPLLETIDLGATEPLELSTRDAGEDANPIEVIESTESAPDLISIDEDVTPAPEPADAGVTDSTFGRQMEAFTETSSGDIVEDFAADGEEARDPDEDLAIALGSAAEGDALSGETTWTQPVAETPAVGELELGGTDFEGVLAGEGTFAGEPAALDATADENVVVPQFDAGDDAVELDTPGLAEADAVLGGQAFVAEGEGQRVAPGATPELDEQAFVAGVGDESGVQEIAPPPQNGDTGDGAPPTAGNGGGFVIGTDLSSFIGGMPLVLPDLAPSAPPSGFGQVGVSFAGPKAPWQQAKRPAFPVGQGLSQDVMDAAEGLRDVEEMDEELAAELVREPGPVAVEDAGEESVTDDGAPGDDWNVAAVFGDDAREEEASSGFVAEAPRAGATDSGAPDSGVGPEADDPGEVGTLEELEQAFGIDGEESALTEEQLLELTADEGVIDEVAATPAPHEPGEMDEQVLGFEIGGGDAGPAGDEPAGLEAITFDEPEGEPSVAGSIEDAVAELHLGEAPAEESVVDRSPPPPVVVPPAPARIQAGRGQGGRVAPPTVVPPPPAKILRGHKRAAGAPPSEDAVFGSLEHGKGAVGAPFAGAGVREVDVFSTPSFEETSEGVGETDGAGAAPFGGPAVGRGNTSNRAGAAGVARGEAKSAMVRGGGVAAQRAIVPPRAEAFSQAGGGGGAPVARVAPLPPARKKNVAGRVVAIVLAMLVSMGLAVGGIYNFFTLKQTTVGELRFQNVGKLTKRQQNELKDEEFRYLNSPQVRQKAVEATQAMGIPAGFLAEPEQFTRVHPVWPDDRLAVMAIQYSGSDPNDPRRVFALLQAMYQQNANRANEAIQLNSDVQKLQKKLKEYQGLMAKRQSLDAVVKASPTEELVRQLEAAVQEADAAYDAAMTAVKDAQLAVRRAGEQLPGSPGEALLKPADKTATPSDPELASLQKALTDAASKATELKGAASEEADAKRKMLDQAVEMFQQTAAGMVRENPQLAQYVQAVQQLQEKTHKLGGDLLDVQMQQHKRLSALKKDMDDQVQARRTEIWAADQGLADLRAQLDLARRKYNAATDQGFTADSKEVKDSQVEIQDLEGKIEARKMTLGNDPIVTKVADALQELINITKERLDLDRARIEKDIKDQEQAFAQSNMIERLPQQQQSQAKALEEKQRAIGDLRKQYADALDRRTAESNASLRGLEAQVTSIRGKIDERKRILAAEGAKHLTDQQEAERRAALEQRQVAMKKAEEQATAAQRQFLDRTKALKNAKAGLAESTAAKQELEAIDQGLAGKHEEAKLDRLALDERLDKLGKLVKVENPVEADHVRVMPAKDDRPMYSLGAVIGLAVLFGVVAVISVAGGDGRAAAPRGGGGEEEFDDDDDETAGFDGGPMAIREIGARDEGDEER